MPAFRQCLLAFARLSSSGSNESKRLLLDIDRERTNLSKAQKELEASRRTLGEQAELHRSQLSEQRQRVEIASQRSAELDGTLTEIRGQRDLLLIEVGELRRRLESSVPVKKPRSKPSKPKTVGNPVT